MGKVLSEQTSCAAVTPVVPKRPTGATLRFQPGEPDADNKEEFVLVLQWGRAFSARKTADSRDREYIGGGASMGPGVFSPEDPPRQAAPAAQPQLQWGRAFSARRTSDKVQDGLEATRLQWGRAFSARRTTVLLRSGLHHPSFNGAGRFQPGGRPP